MFIFILSVIVSSETDKIDIMYRDKTLKSEVFVSS